MQQTRVLRVRMPVGSKPKPPTHTAKPRGQRGPPLPQTSTGAGPKHGQTQIHKQQNTKLIMPHRIKPRWGLSRWRSLSPTNHQFIA